MTQTFNILAELQKQQDVRNGLQSPMNTFNDVCVEDIVNSQDGSNAPTHIHDMTIDDLSEMENKITARIKQLTDSCLRMGMSKEQIMAMKERVRPEIKKLNRKLTFIKATKQNRLLGTELDETFTQKSDPNPIPEDDSPLSKKQPPQDNNIQLANFAHINGD